MTDQDVQIVLMIAGLGLIGWGLGFSVMLGVLLLLIATR